MVLTPARLTEYVRRFQVRVANNFLFELQREEFRTTPKAFPDEFAARETNRWWHTWRDDPRLEAMSKSPDARVGVHQPVQARDVLSSNYFQKYTAIAETQQAMPFSNSIGASYFILHLAMTDRWDRDRSSPDGKGAQDLYLRGVLSRVGFQIHAVH